MKNKSIKLYKFKRKFILSLVFLLIIKIFLLVIYSDKMFSLAMNGRSTGFEHYKIARDIKNNIQTDSIESMNRWMLENYMTMGINENYLPILDKGSHFRLIDGYSACDGVADTYIRIGEFLELKGYTVPLYDQNGSSPHTVVSFIPKKKYKKNIEILNSDKYFDAIRNNALVIDPVYNVVFNNGQDFATLNDICLGNYNSNEKKYLNVGNNGYVNINFFCLTNHRASENDPLNEARLLKKIYYSLFDLIPEFLLFKLYENYIDQLHKDSDYFLKARSHDLFGNYKLARKYYNLSISNNPDNKYNVFQGLESLDSEWTQYMIELTKNGPVYLKDYSRFFLTLLDNKEKSITQKNPFELNEEPFYTLYKNYSYKRIRYMELIK